MENRIESVVIGDRDIKPGRAVDFPDGRIGIAMDQEAYCIPKSSEFASVLSRGIVAVLAAEDVAERHNAHVIEHWGVNVAPWNVHGHRLVAGKPEFNVPHLVDGQPLITFHFSSLRLAPDGTVAQLASAPYEVEWAPGVVELLYRPYINAIKEHVT